MYSTSTLRIASTIWSLSLLTTRGSLAPCAMRSGAAHPFRAELGEAARSIASSFSMSPTIS